MGRGPGSARERLSAPRVRRAASLFAIGVRLVAGCCLVLALACVEPEPLPTLAAARTVAPAGGARTRAVLDVMVRGPQAERGRAAFLAALEAADGGKPASALHLFTRAAPDGGRAVLAARRLGDALAGAGSPAELWRRAAAAAWLSPAESASLLVRGATAIEPLDAVAASALLPPVDSLPAELRPRALGVRARAGDVGAARELAIIAPTRFGELVPGASLATLTARLSAEDRVRHARAWLDAGQPRQALAVAAKAGDQGAVVAAEAALRLRRASAALGWANRAGADPAARLLQAEAHRLRGWLGEGTERRSAFGQALEAVRRSAGLEGEPRVRALLLEAEMLVELNRFADAARLLADPALRQQAARWEWIVHRFYGLQGERRELTASIPGVAGLTGRAYRTATFWESRLAGAPAGLEALARGGYPDLLAHWAADALGLPGVPVAPAEEPFVPPAPPAWGADLLDFGRVADLAVAWRAEIEAGVRPPSDWLGLVALAEIPASDAIGLLVRGEPRLLYGPWTGLPRALLERYLPLSHAEQVEAAAMQGGVPPWLLAGLVRQESAWNRMARSGAGAIGLTQVLPATARELVRQKRLPRDWGARLTEPDVNLTLGALLLDRWRDRLGGSLTAAIAAYNGGERRVRDAWREAGRDHGPLFVEAIEMPETWDYVHRVVLLAEGYRVLYWPEGEAYPWT